MKQNINFGLTALLWMTLACRPVLAISWSEFLIISVLFTVLLGPSLYRLLQRMDNFFRRREKK